MRMQTKRAFAEVTARPNLPELEREIAELWEREGTFAASLAQRREAPRWVFYEGPPTANGKPGTHHVLARSFKDLFPRYRTMKGFLVERKAGWDTHGLPVELEVEKQLGISGKQQIEEFGIDRFNELCRASVYEYVDVWTGLSRRTGLCREYEVVGRMKGADLVGLDYEPLYDYLPPKERAWYVVAADFVSTDEGTGVVHTAAAYGADDLRLCQEKGIPVRHTVDLRGRFLPEVEKFAGLFVKEADPRIIEDLRERGLLYRAQEIRHTYPFCWRCDTTLIYYALDSWYIRTTDFKDELVAQNQATSWTPAYVKNGRMGDWLANNVDWA